MEGRGNTDLPTESGINKWADVVWCGVTLGTLWGAEVFSWKVAAVAIIAGCLALCCSAFAGDRESVRQFETICLSMGVAPCWLTVLNGGSSWGWCILLFCLGVLGLRGHATLGSLPHWVVALGVLESGRAWLVGLAHGVLAPLAGAFAVQSIALAGTLGLGGRTKSKALVLLVTGLAVFVRVADTNKAPVTSGDVVSLHQAGLLAPYLDDLSGNSRLGLRALMLRPRWHELALGLSKHDSVDNMDVARLLRVGWLPEQAPLASDSRIRVARWLEGHNRGGEAVRLLLAGDRSPEERWLLQLFGRSQGNLSVEVQMPVEPPDDVPRLPGEVGLEWHFTHNGSAIIELHCDQTISDLRLEANGEAYLGTPTIEVLVDHRPALVLAIKEERARYSIAKGLEAGPHRILVRFSDDLMDPGKGDRNIHIYGLYGAP